MRSAWTPPAGSSKYLYHAFVLLIVIFTAFSETDAICFAPEKGKDNISEACKFVEHRGFANECVLYAGILDNYKGKGRPVFVHPETKSEDRKPQFWCCTPLCSSGAAAPWCQNGKVKAEFQCPMHLHTKMHPDAQHPDAQHPEAQGYKLHVKELGKKGKGMMDKITKELASLATTNEKGKGKGKQKRKNKKKLGAAAGAAGAGSSSSNEGNRNHGSSSSDGGGGSHEGSNHGGSSHEESNHGEGDGGEGGDSSVLDNINSNIPSSNILDSIGSSIKEGISGVGDTIFGMGNSVGDSITGALSNMSKPSWPNISWPSGGGGNWDFPTEW